MRVFPKNTMMLSVIVLPTLLVGTAAMADVPEQMSYQGFLRDQGGDPVTGKRNTC